MAKGSIEYVVIGFAGDQLRAQLAPALASLDARGAVRVLDVLLIAKDGLGDVVIRRHDELDDRACTGLDVLGTILHGQANRLVTDLDALYAAEELAPGTSAALVAWEPPRACAGGRVVDADVSTAVSGLIPHEPATVALADLVSAGRPGRADGPRARATSTRPSPPERRHRPASARRACGGGFGCGS